MLVTLGDLRVKITPLFKSEQKSVMVGFGWGS